MEESPLLDSSLSEELVSGNLSGMSRRNGRRGQQVIAEISSEGEDDFPEEISDEELDRLE